MFPSCFCRGRSPLGWFLILLILSQGSGRVSAQNVRLTEFMAVNETGLKDEEGTPQPWIEIWNPNQAGKTSITGSKIDNGTVKWTLPNFELMPDERVILFASGKDRTVSTAPLHTRFTLPAGGGSIILRRSDDSVMSRINFSGAGVAGNVVIDTPGKAFTGILDVAVSLEAYLTASVNALYSARQGSGWNNPVTGYAAQLDVPEAIDHARVGATGRFFRFQITGP